MRDRLEVDPQELLRRVPDDATESLVHAQPATIRRYQGHADRRKIEGRAESLFALAQSAFHALARIDIERYADDLERRPGGTALDNPGAIEHPLVLAVRELDAEVGLVESRLVSRGFLEYASMPRRVLRMNVAQPRLRALAGFLLGQVVADRAVPVDVAPNRVARDVVLPDRQPGRVDRKLEAILGLA